MGYYTFRWPRQAQEVVVTGTFDRWSKSVRLDRTDDGFAKELHLPDDDDRILYKFIVDGTWHTDPAASQEETDRDNNVNSVLLSKDLSPTPAATATSPNASAAVMSGVTPESTTAGLAAAVPKEPAAHEATISSAAPESTTAQLAKDVPLEKTPGTFPETPMDEGEVSVNPLPATGTVGNPVKVAPGDKLPESNNVTSNTLGSNVTTDKAGYEKDASDPAMAAMAAADEQQKEFSVNPLPATGTAGNPVKLSPGEQMPESNNVTSSNLNSNVTTDKAGYEKDASDPAMAAMAAADKQQKEFSVNPLPATGTVGNPVKLAPGEKVPGSNDITSNTLDSNVTTDKAGYEKDASDPAMAALAAQQHQHDQKNTYSALPVDTAPKSKTAGPNDNPTIQSSAPQATTAALAGAVPLEKARNAVDSTAQYDPEVPAKQVPDLVKESMSKAHTDPEAACIPEMVKEKKELEQELLDEVPPATGSGQPAPTTSAALASTAPAATGSTTTKPVQKQDDHHPGTGDISPKSHEPDAPAGGEGPIATGMTASQVPSAPTEPPKETPQVTTGPATKSIPETSGVPERKPVEPKTTATATAGAPSAQNGTTTDTAETLDKKKKHRVSGFLHKLKEKFA
ncbi:Cruciform DNA binding protein [Microsporum audouinii]